MREKLQAEIRNEVLICLRRIIRAIDLHSHDLVQTHGVTGPQALILSQISQAGETSAVRLARETHLSKPTISGVLARLEKRALISRTTDGADRRREIIRITEEGLKLLDSAPPLLQESFIDRFDRLPEFEQTMILSALQKIAEMMDAKDLEAGRLLASGAHIHAEVASMHR